MPIIRQRYRARTIHIVIREPILYIIFTGILECRNALNLLCFLALKQYDKYYTTKRQECQYFFLKNNKKIFFQKNLKKGLTRVRLCAIIVKQSGQRVLTKTIKHRGVEQFGSSSGS